MTDRPYSTGPNESLGGWAAAGSIQNQQPQPAPPSSFPILGTLSQGEELLSYLHEAVTKLENRLAPILTPAPDTKGQPVGASQSHSGGGSEVFHRLASLDDSLDYLGQRLGDLVRRVEV